MAPSEQTPGLIRAARNEAKGLLSGGTGQFPQLGRLPFCVPAAAAQPGSTPRPLLPTRCKRPEPKACPRGAGWALGLAAEPPRKAPRSQPSRQVLRGVSVQPRAGNPPSFLPPSLLPTPPHALVALQGLIHSPVTNMQMGAFCMGRAPGCWVSGHPREPEVGRGVARRRMLPWPCMATGNGALGPLGSGPTPGLRGSGWQRREGKLAAPGNLGLTAGGWAHRGFPSAGRMVNLESVHAGKGHSRKDRAGARRVAGTVDLGRKWDCSDSCDLSSLLSLLCSPAGVGCRSRCLVKCPRSYLGMDAAPILFRGLPSHAHNVGAPLTLPALMWVGEQSAEVSWVPGKTSI